MDPGHGRRTRGSEGRDVLIIRDGAITAVYVLIDAPQEPATT